MSWSIPALIEADFKSGKAQYRTFQTGNGGQSILPVPPNSYVVIFGYDFSPAGGGISVSGALQLPTTNDARVIPTNFGFYETQQISFYTGTDFYPFIHHVNCEFTAVPNIVNAISPEEERLVSALGIWTIDNSPIARQVYITSTNDVTITHGLINNAPRASANAIPVTNRTPQGLTYGGSPQVITTQSNYGPAGSPQQFIQPSPKDYEDFAFGLLPNNADGQAFATPDITNGLRDSSQLAQAIYGIQNAFLQYFLCLHYALYTETVPDSRG